MWDLMDDSINNTINNVLEDIFIFCYLLLFYYISMNAHLNGSNIYYFLSLSPV